MLALFAQVSSDSVPPWLSVFLQGGAFLLVVYIVIIVYPKAAKEAREEREARDARFVTVIDTLHGKFDERNTHVVAAVKEQTALISKAFEASASRIEFAVKTACKANYAPHLRGGEPS